MFQNSRVMTQSNSVDISIIDSSKNATYSYDSSLIYKVCTYESFYDALYSI